MSLLGIDRARLFLSFPEIVPQDVTQHLIDQVTRRLNGEPIAYITGQREFMGLEFHVDPRVLIPRPETEGLVERAFSWLSRHLEARRVVDVGTGSGAIAISIQRLSQLDRPLTVVGSDISGEALAVARENATCLKATGVNLVQGDLLDWCSASLDLVVANLPYLRESQRHAGIAQEPGGALFAADGGFALYSALIPQVAELLSTRGALMCEIDPDQRETALATAQHAFSGAAIRVEPDLSGRDRYLIVDKAA